MRVSVSKDTHYDCWNDYSSDLCIMTNETELNICLELLQQSPFQSGSDAVDSLETKYTAFNILRAD